MLSLETDPLLSECGFSQLHESSNSNWRDDAETIFEPLSSGHKVVCLTITQLVAKVTERTLVLIDEPESHLHPPLLSAFIRALSDLLIDQNGVAIIATHSPVVVQEVPRSCVWVLRKSGKESLADRPEIETFGENVGILTRQIFGLEVVKSGFHRLLGEAVEEHADYDSIVRHLNGQLGSEARAIIQSLIAEKTRRELYDDETSS